MDVGIVTGGSSGIGLSVTKKLIELGYKVYGIARDFSKADFTHNHFIPLVSDITDTQKTVSLVKEVLHREGDIHILVNNAGVGYFGPHETINPEKLEQMVKTNLLAPLVLTQLVLRSLKNTQGYVINIASITALHSSRFGCAYAATKAGLDQFGISLFDEVRKSGVKVVTIYPDIVQTPFYDHLDFKAYDDPEYYITPECIADAVEYIITRRNGTVITQMVIRPQKHRLEHKKFHK